MTIKQIRDLIAAGKTEDALRATKSLPAVQSDQAHSDLVDNLLSQFNTNRRERLVGIIGMDKEMQINARIIMALQDLLERLAEPGAAPIKEQAPAVADPPAPGTGSGGADGITKMLFLTANPSDTSKLRLDEEYASVSERLQEALEPHKYPIKRKRAVTPSQFSQFLFLERPDIVHFSGHGDLKSPDNQAIVSELRMGREQITTAVPKEPAEQESGIFLMSEDRRASHFVSTSFLEQTFKVMVERQGIAIRAVVFNACHSSQQAEVLSQIVPYVVGTSWSVKDDAAIAFATGFYFGIAQGMDIDKAFDFGTINALAFNEPKDRFLLYKHGVKVEW
ncbi:MAG: CHAT domain-containing protein [Bacteroidota bacterium]